jgi:hypothetical protein
MNKALKMLGIYLILVVVSGSCSPDHFLITGVDFSGAKAIERKNDREYNQFTQTNLLKDEIIFTLRYNTEFVASLDLGMSAKCYAFTKGTKIDNYLLENTYSLKFDHPFTYKNVTINANQNLLEIEEIKSQIEIYDGYYADKIIEFSQNLKNDCVFTSDDYEITFNCNTSDNRYFEKRIIVKIEN